ncbi:MAG: hypothetical protein ACOYYS_21930 [Chloroflexota bacterium]
MKKKLSFIIILALAALTLVGGIYASSAASTISTDVTHEVVFSIPVGDKGIHYASDGPDMLIWGPPAITVAPDGTFWIADTADNHLLHFNSEGVLLDKIAVGDFAVGVGDIEVTSKAIWVLDMASIPPKVVQLSLKGKVLGHYDLPKGLYPEDGLSGIAIGSDGSVLIEQGDGVNITRFVDPSGGREQESLEGYLLQDKVYSAYPAELVSDDPSRRYIQAGNKRIGVEFATDLGGLIILNVNSDGSFWVVAEEVVFNPAVQVDEKVYRYDASGNLVGMARIPLAEMYTSVAHGIVVGPDDNVYILVTKPDRAEVQRLIFSARLSPILIPSTSREDVAQSYAESATQLTCRTRTSMISVAAGYRNNSTYLNSYHINDPYGQCPSRTKPRYLTTAKNYSSVPYAWGIADTVAQFNSFMNGGNNAKFAGDYTDPNSGCGRG